MLRGNRLVILRAQIREVAPVGGQDAARPLDLGQPDQRGIGKIDLLVRVSFDDAANAVDIVRLDWPQPQGTAPDPFQQRQLAAGIEKETGLDHGGPNAQQCCPFCPEAGSKQAFRAVMPVILAVEQRHEKTGVSRATAWRELADLVAKGCLRTTGKGGRSSGYEIDW